VGGYSLGEVASALQKSIRRCDEEGALFWATELDLSGYGEYCWKRLRIITSEDVGLAEPGMPANIQALYQAWSDQRKKKDERHGPERLFLVHAVILLARAKKSRMVDHALIAYYEAERPTRSIPDCALDKHTIAGKRLGRGHEHFWTEGAKVENAAQIEDPYYAVARTTRTSRPAKVSQPQQPELLRAYPPQRQSAPAGLALAGALLYRPRAGSFSR
jgi:replication-associated recombination protein RarA